MRWQHKNQGDQHAGREKMFAKAVQLKNCRAAFLEPNPHRRQPRYGGGGGTSALMKRDRSRGRPWRSSALGRRHAPPHTHPHTRTGASLLPPARTGRPTTPRPRQRPPRTSPPPPAPAPGHLPQVLQRLQHVALQQLELHPAAGHGGRTCATAGLSAPGTRSPPPPAPGPAPRGGRLHGRTPPPPYGAGEARSPRRTPVPGPGPRSPSPVAVPAAPRTPLARCCAADCRLGLSGRGGREEQVPGLTPRPASLGPPRRHA